MVAGAGASVVMGKVVMFDTAKLNSSCFSGPDTLIYRQYAHASHDWGKGKGGAWGDM